MSSRNEPTVLDRFWAYGDIVSTALIIVGAFGAVLFGIAGVIAMLAGLAVALSTHLIVGAIQYRRVMSREWPKVRPLDPDDEW